MSVEFRVGSDTKEIEREREEQRKYLEARSIVKQKRVSKTLRDAVDMSFRHAEFEFKKAVVLRTIKRTINALFLIASGSIFIMSRSNMKAYLTAIIAYIIILMAFELTKFILEAKRRRGSYYMKRKQAAMLGNDIPRIRYFMDSPEMVDKYRNLMAIKARNYLKTKRPQGFIKNKRARILTYSLRLFADALDEAVSRLKYFTKNPEKAEIVPPERFQYIKDNIIRQSFICLFSANGQTRETARSNLSTECMMMHPELTYFVWQVYKKVTRFKLQVTSYHGKDEGER